MQANQTPVGIYAAMAAIIGALSREGIGKSHEVNAGRGGKYKFRGIDDVYNALSSLLAEHKVVIFPECLEHRTEERESSGGATGYHHFVKVRYTFAHVDGSTHAAVTIGEAMDYGDKGAGKAQSYAFKVACLEAFCIPTEGDNDPDATVHPPSRPLQKPNLPPPPKRQGEILDSDTGLPRSTTDDDGRPDPGELLRAKMQKLVKIKELCSELGMSRSELERFVWELLKREVSMPDGKTAAAHLLPAEVDRILAALEDELATRAGPPRKR